MAVPGTLIVNFIDGLRQSDVLKILDEHKLRGTRVSSLTNKYTVEVPFGKEQHFAKILELDGGVKSVR